MIHIKELRVGSKVIFPEGLGEDWVESVRVNDEDDVNDPSYCTYLIDGFKLNELKPIRVIPEILNKCGFVKTGRYAIGVGGYDIWRKENGNKRAIELMQVAKDGPFTLAFYETSIQHLHQLQNVYFALTGTELNYQP